MLGEWLTTGPFAEVGANDSANCNRLDEGLPIGLT